MRLVIGHDEAIANWVGWKIGIPIAPPYTAFGWIDVSGKLQVGFVFFGFIPEGNIEFALATSGKLLPGMLAAVADYVFRQSGCSRMTARTRRSNTKACEQLKRAGFVKEADCKAFYGDEDALQFRLLKKHCKWLRHGHIKSSPAS